MVFYFVDWKCFLDGVGVYFFFELVNDWLVSFLGWIVLIELLFFSSFLVLQVLLMYWMFVEGGLLGGELWSRVVFFLLYFLFSFLIVVVLGCFCWCLWLLVFVVLFVLVEVFYMYQFGLFFGVYLYGVIVEINFDEVGVWIGVWCVGFIFGVLVMLVWIGWVV